MKQEAGGHAHSDTHSHEETHPRRETNTHTHKERERLICLSRARTAAVTWHAYKVSFSSTYPAVEEWNESEKTARMKERAKMSLTCLAAALAYQSA